MNVLYSREKIPASITKSIFLAGPTPRSSNVKSWRPDALIYLYSVNYNGIVFVPEDRPNGNTEYSYSSQVEWEETCLNIADCILFWIPRSKELPGLTTNHEFGTWCASGKVVLGCPDSALSVTYQKYYAAKYKIPTASTLNTTLDNAITMLGAGAARTNGEIYVPLLIWNLSSFQSWYCNHKSLGNTLHNARLLYRYGVRKMTFLWILKVSIYIAKENRYKTGEFVIARPDISSVMLWYKCNNILDSQIVLVKEFRSAAKTKDGFVRELPGGSDFTNEDAATVAIKEVCEETGFTIEQNRLIDHGQRQLMATLSSHTNHLYEVQLTMTELEWFKAQKGIVHGCVQESERTFVEIYTIGELMNEELTDWSTLGQILSIANKK